MAQEETPKNFGRIAAQTAKQVVMQRLREAERGQIMDEVSSKQDELITVIVRRTEGENVYCDMGMSQVEGVLGPKDRIPGEKYVPNSRLKVLVRAVKESFNMPYVQLSRTSPNFVKKLFELEVPEVQTGDVVIKHIVREAGYRTKLSVYSPNPNLDCIGACVGNRGMRVNAIVSELNGEKIDIVLYNDDPVEFISAALSPATVLHVELNHNEKSCLAVVPDEKLSLAIGKNGQNVRLAARLTGWKIDVKAKSVVPSFDLNDDFAPNDNYEQLFDGDDAFGDLN